jgi:hypothetical protein
MKNQFKLFVVAAAAAATTSAVVIFEGYVVLFCVVCRSKERKHFQMNFCCVIVFVQFYFSVFGAFALTHFCAEFSCEKQVRNE